MIIAAENKVLLLNEKQEDKSAGGIILTGGKESDTLKLKVVDVGGDKTTKELIGKFAIVGRHNGYQFVHDGVDYKVCTLNDVLAWCTGISEES